MALRGEPGRLVGGRYRLVEPLGSGGFGQVWRAVDESLRVEVAVKEVWLPPAASAREQADRLARAEREGRNAAALRDNRNIVTVHDILIEDDMPWLVMQLVRGMSLLQRIDEDGPLPVAEAVGVALAVLDALGAAHAAGIVHRDVKPGNVLLADDGGILLTDFGIATHEADTRLTVSGSVIGSLEYMAPEQLNGDANGSAGDLYSLGVTLYHTVEGVSPFRRATAAATMAAVILETAPPLRRAGVLGPLVTALMDKDPARRPTVAQAQAMTMSKVPPPRAPRGPRTGFLAAGAAVVCAGLIAGAILLSRGGDVDKSGKSITPPTTATSGAQGTPNPTAFAPVVMDDASTDPVPLTAAAMLPPTYVNQLGSVYVLTSSSVHGCEAQGMSPPIQSALNVGGCNSTLFANYIGPGAGGTNTPIMVSLEIFVFENATDAQRTADALKTITHNSKYASLGMRCPESGTGTNICRDGWRNTFDTYVAAQHRYVLAATALYADGTTPVDNWTNTATGYPVNNCGPKYYISTRT
ncbi:serine/threonine-protein kinase [Kitasatospora sp. NPDC092286]|uniref:serine/threonine-protein kinase n=1 Tax=Kitasatospora sp. NPDC092286 TaxID=3364087 RepID=UPI00381E8809